MAPSSRRLRKAPVAEIAIGYSGDLAEVDTQPLTRYIVKGVLAHHLGSDQVNIINSLHLAKERGVNIVVNKSNTAKDFTNLVTVSLRSRNETRHVAGTLLTGYGPRIVQIDNYPVDVAPAGHLVLIAHHDRPGIIGRIGTLLGSNDVNIATMQVGRQAEGGAAIMVLTVDKGVPKAVLSQMTQLDELKSAKEISLFA